MAESNEQRTAFHSSNALCIRACRADDVSLMEQAISVASKSGSSQVVQDVVQRGLSRSASRRAVHVLGYLVDHLHGANIAALTAGNIMNIEDVEKPSQEILEILVAHGWDINTQGLGKRTSWPLLWYVVEYPDLVTWCLDHGARVDLPTNRPPIVDKGPQNYTESPRPTILGMAASSGTVETFELLRAKGALMDRRTLHRAVEQVTYLAPKQGEEPSSFYTGSMDMVRHLVDVVKLDVNAVEHELGKACRTPLCIAVDRPTNQIFQKLIHFLLDRGADPYLDCRLLDETSHWGAIDCAQAHGNIDFLEAVENWEAKKQAEKHGE